MEITGIERDLQGDGQGENRVETIEVWYSARRRAWFVERLDASGDQIGLAHRCADEGEASACLAEWLRAHDSTHVAMPWALDPAEQRVLAHSVRRAA